MRSLFHLFDTKTQATVATNGLEMATQAARGRFVLTNQFAQRLAYTRGFLDGVGLDDMMVPDDVIVAKLTLIEREEEEDRK